MAFFDFMRREVKDSAVGRMLVLGKSEAKWSNRNYASFAREGYQMNVVAYQAINKIAEAVASVPWLLWRGKVEITSHKAIDLMNRPNKSQGYDEFIKAFVGFYYLSGNGYVEKVLIGKEVRELYTHRPDRMSIIGSDTGLAKAYQYKVKGQTHTWEMDPVTGAGDIFHAKTFNPLDDWYGLSPIEAGAFAIDQHNESMKWMQALLQNSARPSGALVAKDDRELSDDQYARLKAQIEDQYSGAQNAGRPMLLEGGMDWKQMGFSPSDMSILETKYSSARDVCLALGVPPLLMGIKGDNTFANYKEARLAFWEDTIIPFLQVLQSGLFRWVAEQFDGDIEFRPDLDQIPAIAEKRAILWDMADKSEDLTINERRAIKGYEPIKGGDDVMVPATMVPLGYTSDTVTPDEEKALLRLVGYEKKAD